MKKTSSIFITFFSVCFLSSVFLFLTPISVLAACPPDCAAGQNPEYNLDIRGWQDLPASQQDLNLQDYFHPTDPVAYPPQFTGLIQGNPYPTVTSIKSVNQLPTDDPRSWSQVTAVGFGTASGQQILVPPSGRSIYQTSAGSYQAIVLYADSNNVALKYTLEDSIVTGYTVYLSNFQVNPSVVSAYQQANAAGRTELPALSGFFSLGTATGQELVVAIRDTGAFLDPRWRFDWWQIIVDPTNPLAILMINLLEPPPSQAPSYNQCITSGAPATTFRPYPYGSCVLKPDPEVLDKGFATTFKAFQTVTLHYGAFDECDGKRVAHVDWGGLVTVHMEEPYLPFAGYGASDNIPEAETKYLADYFDGTAFYDGQPADLNNPDDVKRVFSEAGVFRKLTPQSVKDKYRCFMVQRAKQSTAGEEKNPVHDYTITLNGESQKLTQFTCPPAIGTSAYDQWKTTLSGRLWPAVPVTTRDDYPGEVMLTVQSPPGVLQNPGPYPISVPHMARLEEISTLVRKIVLSEYSLHSLAENINQIGSKVLGLNSPKLLASAEISTGFQKPLASAQKSPPTSSNCPQPISNDSLLTTNVQPSTTYNLPTTTKNRLLAQGGTGGTSSCPPGLAVHQSVDTNGNINFSFTETLINNCYYNDTTVNVEYSVNGQSAGGCSEFFRVITHNDPNDPNNHPLPFACQPNYNTSQGGTVTAKVSWFGSVNGGSQEYCGNSTAQGSSCQCSTTVTNGQLSTTCIIGEALPAGSQCRNLDTINPPDREEDAEQDLINPPNLDHFSQGPIETFLTVQGYAIRMDPEDWEHWACCANACLNAVDRKACCDQSECGCCSPLKDFDVYRRIGTDIYFPYMKKTWEQIAKLDSGGLFHIFTPENQKDFEEKYAKDQISFEFNPGWTDPSSGWVYFPYLGGTQLAKECVINKILCAQSLQGKYCNAAAKCPPFATPTP